MKHFLLLTIAGALLIVSGLWLYKSYADANFFADYDPDHPLNPKLQKVERVADSKNIFDVQVERQFRKQLFEFEARDGEMVPCLMTMPLKPQKQKMPAIVFVHGSGQSKDFIEQICTPFNRAGFAMVSFDQFNRGPRRIPKDSGLLAEGWAWRNRAWKTIVDSRRLIDYLETRNDIDPDRIYLVGASWGAITGTTIVAQDKRLKAAVLVVGGGDIDLLLNAPLIRKEVPAAAIMLAKPLVRYFVGAIDPIFSAKDTSPTPVLMQVGADDTLVSPESGKALFEVMGEPKELRIYPIDHPGLRKGDGEEILNMLNEGLFWLMEQDGENRSRELKAQDKRLIASLEQERKSWAVAKAERLAREAAKPPKKASSSIHRIPDYKLRHETMAKAGRTKDKQKPGPAAQDEKSSSTLAHAREEQRGKATSSMQRRKADVQAADKAAPRASATKKAAASSSKTEKQERAKRKAERQQARKKERAESGKASSSKDESGAKDSRAEQRPAKKTQHERKPAKNREQEGTSIISGEGFLTGTGI